MFCLGYGVLGGVYKLNERVNLEAGSADQRAVDVLLGHYLCGVFRLDGAAVQDAYALGEVFSHFFFEEVTDPAGGVLGVFGGGGVAGTYGPDGLVGENDALAVYVFELFDHPRELAGDLVPHATRVAFPFGLAYADDGQQVGVHGALRLSGDRVVGLAEGLAPLGVAHDHGPGPRVEEHGRGDLAGEGAGVFEVEVLRARGDPGVLGHPAHLVQAGEGDADGHVHLVGVGGTGQQGGRVLFCFPYGLVHLPVSRHHRASGHDLLLYLPGRTATPGSSLPSTYSSEAPPPVEMWLISPSSPSLLTAATESPPPTTLVASLSATAFATPSVPFAKASISKTPMGPFQKMVRASEMCPSKRATVSWPMSRPSLPDGMSSTGTVSVSTPSSIASATTTSTGRINLSSASPMRRLASSR